ncbi:hypothetical protein IDH44_07665 [Paenibacillus sp. IB182496]|uniref:Photosynthesis system II assembly factor Ycf48/Hcf136-like domain-containing protein n=1 Tax=Paenibacillus sabuli TaxID=2772509 RepID=A0A927BT67_9BACL|nr:hypothetical protein [Paenibacillus sabuli]MBD2845064.1 hypothetical protein [Paenibacillus sabuli]
MDYSGKQALRRHRNRNWTLVLLFALLLAVAAGCGAQGDQAASGGNGSGGAPSEANNGANGGTDDSGDGIGETDADQEADNAASGSPSTPSDNEAGDAGDGAQSPSNGGSPTDSADSGGAAGPLGGAVTALRLADDETGWVGGEGWIARTEDGGRKWTTVYEGDDIVRQIFALDDQRVWATLEAAQDEAARTLLGSTDGGHTWMEIGEVPEGKFLHFVSEQEAYSGSVQTRDGGRTWKRLRVPDGTAGEPYFHDRDNGWAVTAANGQFDIMRTTDGGQSWRSVKQGQFESPQLGGAIIRSAGEQDAWVELIGGSGMSQTSYSLFHTTDGGATWIPVLANSGAGSGPAPGYAIGEEPDVPANAGNGPGALYVASEEVAFMGGQCLACDQANTLGKTTDGGNTWTNLDAEYPGYGEQHLAAADAQHVWWITTDHSEPSVMMTSADGGSHWDKAFTFGSPDKQ